MTKGRDPHALCDRPPPSYTQTILNSSNGYSQLRVPQTRQYCTPAPNAVRRMANTPSFTTTDPRLTSFLRLPAEIRLQIYALLLLADKSIPYGLCPTKSRFVLRSGLPGQPYIRGALPYTRIAIFPSILRCCRLIHREGTPILYSRNTFELERVTAEPVVYSLAIPPRNFERIAKIRMRPEAPSRARDVSIDDMLGQMTYLELLPGLEEVIVPCQDATPRSLADKVRRGVPARHDARWKVIFECRVTRQLVRIPQPGVEGYLKEYYREALEALDGYAAETRRVVEVFEDYTVFEEAEREEGSYLNPYPYDDRLWAMMRIVVA